MGEGAATEEHGNWPRSGRPVVPVPVCMMAARRSRRPRAGDVLRPGAMGVTVAASLTELGHEVRWLSAGRSHIYLHGRSNVWDYAAGQFIFQRAGGLSCTLDGEAVFTQALTPRLRAAASEGAQDAVPADRGPDALGGRLERPLARIGGLRRLRRRGP